MPQQQLFVSNFSPIFLKNRYPSATLFKLLEKRKNVTSQFLGGEKGSYFQVIEEEPKGTRAR